MIFPSTSELVYFSNKKIDCLFYVAVLWHNELKWVAVYREMDIYANDVLGKLIIEPKSRKSIVIFNLYI